MLDLTKRDASDIGLMLALLSFTPIHTRSNKVEDPRKAWKETLSDRMKGISMMEFARAMKDKTKDTMNTMSMIEFLVFVGYQYGLLVEGVIDHRIHDASFASADDIRFNPGKYSGGCFSITYSRRGVAFTWATNEEEGLALEYLAPVNMATLEEIEECVANPSSEYNREE